METAKMGDMELLLCGYLCLMANRYSVATILNIDLNT